MTQPRNFSWFVEGKLAGMAYPEKENIPFLVEAGVKRLVNMTEHDAEYTKVASASGITVHNICVAAFCPPSVQQIQEFLDILDSNSEVGMIYHL